MTNTLSTAQETSLAQDPEYERNVELEDESGPEAKDMAPKQK
jgi:ABC transporter ATM